MYFDVMRKVFTPGSKCDIPMPCPAIFPIAEINESGMLPFFDKVGHKLYYGGFYLRIMFSRKFVGFKTFITQKTKSIYGMSVAVGVGQWVF